MVEDKSLDSLPLSIRIKNCFKTIGINTLSELLSFPECKLYTVRNLGKKSIDELIAFRKQYEVSLPSYAEKPSDSSRLSNDSFIFKLGMKIDYNCFGFVINQHYSLDVILDDTDIADKFKKRISIFGSTMKEIAMSDYDSMVSCRGIGKAVVDNLVSWFYTHCVSCPQIANLYKYEKDFKRMNKLLLGNLKIPYALSFVSVIKYNLETVIANQDITARKKSINYLLLKDKRILSNENVHAILRKIIYSLTPVDSSWIARCIYEQRLPDYCFESGIVDVILKEFVSEGIFDLEDNQYRRHLTTVKEWLAKLDSRSRDVLELRIDGKTLQEVGETFDITRERVRQIESKALKNRPVLQADRLSYWFQKYNLNKELLDKIFKLKDSEYGYLKITYKPGNLSFEEIRNDEKATSAIKSRVTRIIRKDKVVVGNKELPLSRPAIVTYLLKKNCTNRSLSFDELYNLYIAFLKEHGLEDDDRFTYPTMHAFISNLSSFNLVKNVHDKVRYYDVENYDFECLVSSLHFEQYMTRQISTLRIFNQYPTVMKRFDIHDHYELYNILVLTKDLWHSEKYDITFRRTPTIDFGRVDKEKQVIDLLRKTSPIRRSLFAELFEAEYGINANMVATNGLWLPYLDPFTHDGICKIDEAELNDEELVFLQERLIEDFYFVDDVEKIYLEKFKRGKKRFSKFGHYSFYQLGFDAYSDYMISRQYKTVTSYFKSLYMKNEELVLADINPRKLSISSSIRTLYELKQSFDLIEISDDDFVTYWHLHESIPEVTKSLIKDFIVHVKKYAGHSMFTFEYLVKRGFKHKLCDCFFDSHILELLIRNSGEFKISSIANVSVFTCFDSSPSVELLVLTILGDRNKISVSDLVHVFREEYGIDIRYDVLTSKLHDTGLYYNSVMKKVYKSKDCFLDDLN